ncbi:MAG TPA: ribose 5-phosphate isomerase B [Acidimicrobiia bacterium]
MARRDLPNEEAVRALVTRVVDAVAVAPVAMAERSEASPLPTDGAIAIGADHGGFRLKERLGFRLREAGRRVVDCGTDSTEAVDYPDFALAVAEKVASGECSEGIVVDGAGIGSAMVANKVPGVRAALCYDISSARNSREHNHANVLTLGAGLIGEALAWQIVEEWLATPWAGGRHAKRVEKIDAVDHRYARLGEAV